MFPNKPAINPRQENPETESEQTERTRAAYILAATNTAGLEGCREQLGKFHDVLQQEADARFFPFPERNIWYNLEVTRAYLDAGQLEYAREALRDAMTVLENLEEEHVREKTIEGYKEEVEALIAQVIIEMAQKQTITGLD
ncbi:hypothetical protein KKB83_02980 [Patescibacteria group bacterium]|nr:hypothetical protein [Patescibacteria group bacterium]